MALNAALSTLTQRDPAYAGTPLHSYAVAARISSGVRRTQMGIPMRLRKMGTLILTRSQGADQKPQDNAGPKPYGYGAAMPTAPPSAGMTQVSHQGSRPYLPQAVADAVRHVGYLTTRWASSMWYSHSVSMLRGVAGRMHTILILLAKFGMTGTGAPCASHCGWSLWVARSQTW